MSWAEAAARSFPECRSVLVGFSLSPGVLQSWQEVESCAQGCSGVGGERGWEVRQGVWQGGLEQFSAPPPAFGVAAKLIISPG